MAASFESFATFRNNSWKNGERDLLFQRPYPDITETGWIPVILEGQRQAVFVFLVGCSNEVCGWTGENRGILYEHSVEKYRYGSRFSY